jgi:3-oxoacyl-[acyl-carrier protein] reductase
MLWSVSAKEWATMAGRLDGRTAIVLGGARGIGEGVVAVLVREGARVVMGDLLSELGADVVARHRDKAEFVQADMSKRADMQRVAAHTLERYGRIDILCQVAGIYPTHLIEDIPEEEWDRVLAVNLKGPFLAIQACFPAMKRQRYGRILLTGSITGPHVTWPEHAHYAASKAGLVGLAKTAALEGAAFGITANVVEPGNVETANVRRERGAEHMITMAKAVPLGRLALPEEIGEAMAFLASDAAGYITGTTLVLDGGQLLPEARLG